MQHLGQSAAGIILKSLSSHRSVRVLSKFVASFFFYGLVVKTLDGCSVTYARSRPQSFAGTAVLATGCDHHRCAGKKTRM